MLSKLSVFRKTNVIVFLAEVMILEKALRFKKNSKEWVYILQ